MIADDIHRMWHNGTKGLLIAFAGLLTSVLLFVGVSLFALERWRAKDSFAPLDYPSPQRVINPIVRPGETVNVEGYKCNNEDHPIAVQAIDGAPLLRSLDTQALIPRPGPRLDAYVRQPGCPLLKFANPLPADLPPGNYRIEGVEVATEGSKEQREAWFTEPFCLTNAMGEGC